MVRGYAHDEAVRGSMRQTYISNKSSVDFAIYTLAKKLLQQALPLQFSKEDKVITAYRDHAHPIALGMDPEIRYGRAVRESNGLLQG